ncbi:MAG TPA: SGNH/GDSL hydrolase family protein, partial [Armatimonadota bacterium]|nr:SGNH/GDSL hydrolase family protein [Armatimonadota bacterium]
MALPFLFVIGDSISLGYGPHLDTFARDQYRYARKSGEEAWLPEAVRAQGANGGDSTAVLRYLDAMAAADVPRPGVLLLNCGLHDIRHDPATGAKQVPPETYAANLARILPLARGLCGRLIWVRTTDVDEAMHNIDTRPFYRFNRDIDAYNALADDLMRAAGVEIADLRGFTAAIPGEIYRDGVHFLDHVCALQGAFLAGYLQRAP